MHINVGSETEPTKLQIQTESERADLIVTAPLAIHNTICHKRIEPECTQCQAHAHRQSRLKRYATCLAIAASLALCAAMAATVLPATSKHDEPGQTQDHCYNDGNPYSVGSIEKMDDGQFRECVAVSNQASQWQALNRYMLH
ncbi:hypothetical protein [Undibacterium sp.]|uniref:hypothetical protein n=1 Tax=Undibacterium sp. TaxID=1914977 RepID=UPI002731761E|nr:hypothetical protein [Undibacterium sp.]MDP1979223.1 hypothetical protein [Undibacterium sp.]